jgi:lipopolysaccharide export system permease protein
MYIIRRIITQEWLKFFFISFVGLLVLLTVGNLLPGFLRGNVTPQEVIFNHLIELPGNMKKILPITCLVASLFSINKLKNRNELVAIFASGFNRTQFLSTIFWLSASIGFMLFLISGYIDPYVKSKRSDLISDSGRKFRNLKSQGLKSSTFGSGRIWYRGSNYFFSFKAYNKVDKVLSGVNLYYVDQAGALSKRVLATQLIHQVGNLWKGTNVRVSSKLSTNQFADFKRHKELVISIDESPIDFLQIESDITTLTPIKLKRYIDQLKDVGINTNEYEMLHYDKYASAVLCIIFAILASLSIFTPNRRTASPGKNFFFIFVFVIGYWLVYSYFYELGKNSKLPPEFASGFVPLVFILFISVIFLRNRKLS